MLVHATPRQAAAIVRAMRCVATGDGADTLTAGDATAIEACHHVMLHRTKPRACIPSSRWPGTSFP